MQDKIYDVIVVGAGIAGFVAAAEGVKAVLSAYNYLRSKQGLPAVNVGWKAEKKKATMSIRL